MSETMIRAVTFDLWHTVIEEPMENFSDFLRKGRAEAMERVFEAHGTPHPLEEIERAYDVQGKRLWDIWSRGADIDERAQIGIVLSELGTRPDEADNAIVEDLIEVYNEVLARTPPVPFDGASELLGTLKDRGLSMAIISNTGRTGGEFFRGLLEEYGLAQYFEAMTFSNEAGIRKPNKEIFLDTLKQLEVGPEEAIHVGDDSDTDVMGAKNAGMKGVLLLVPGRGPDRGDPDYVVSRLQEMLDVIDELEGAS
jgi:putative hydrolase of the HAD superfamily